MKENSKSKRDYYIALLFISLSVILWGYSFISTKVVLSEIPPVSIAFFRQIIASIVLAVWLLVTRSFVKIPVKDLALLSLSSLFGVVLYFVFENTGLKFTSASNASLIVAAVPVFTLITEALFFKLKISTKMVFCIVLSIAGVYLIISTDGKLDFSSSSFKGNLLVVGAMAAWVVYTILNKGLSEKYSSMLITAYQIMISVFLFIPFTLPEIRRWEGITLVPLLNLIYLGVFCSAFAYFFYIYAAKRLGPTISSAFLNLIPVVSVIAGYFVLNETLQLLQMAGMGLIILSLYKLSR